MDNQGYRGYPGEEHIYTQAKIQPVKPFWRRHILPITLSIALILMVVFAATTILLLLRPPQKSENNGGITNSISSPAPTSVPTVSTPTENSTPDATATAAAATAAITPTSAPVSNLPCVVNIATWTSGSQDWTVHNGTLYNDGTNGNATAGPTIVASCLPNVSNYSVEAKIQVTNTPEDYSCFGIVFRGSSSQNGWEGYKADICSNNTADISAYGDYNSLTQAPFTPGTTTHTYRVDVQDNSIKLFIDGNLIDNTTDNRLLTSETGEGVGLYSQNVQLQVNSFQVTALS